MNEKRQQQNQNILHSLSQNYYRANGARNRVLICAVIVGMLVLNTVFSISIGKIQAEVLRETRQGGTVATTYLERGTAAQQEVLEHLSYVKCVGRAYDIGYAYAQEELCCQIRALDATAWETLTAPAYTEVTGTYPKERGEIMLSVRALEKIGIANPTVGMELSLRLDHNLQDAGQESYVLSGFFTDHTSTERDPVGYISQTQAEYLGVDWDKPDELQILQKDTISAGKIEDRLYADVQTTDDSQRFFGGNTYAYEAMQKLAGGYGLAAGCGLLILISAFLLIQNVMTISMQQEIQQYGLLHTLGTTRKQQRQIFLRQTGRIALVSLMVGGILSAGISYVVIPRILEKLYLAETGGTDGLSLLRPQWYVLSLGFMILVLYVAAGRTLYKMGKLEPLEALHYIGEAEAGIGKGTKRKAHPRYQLAHMAWKNVRRYPKRFVVTIASLVLGILVALVTVVLGRGLDQTNEIEAKPDFTIQNTVSPADGATWDDAGVDMSACYYDSFSPVSAELEERIRAIDGIQKDTLHTTGGAYLDIKDQGEGLFAWANAGGYSREQYEEYKENGLFVDAAIVQVVDEAYLSELEDYVNRGNLAVDMESLLSGEAVLLLHPHRLSPALEEVAVGSVGEKLLFGSLPTQEWVTRRARETEGMSLAELWNYSQTKEEADTGIENERWANAVTMQLAGYIDSEAGGFPAFVTERTYESEGTLYFLASQAGFAKLAAKQKTFQIQFDVEKGKEEQVKLDLQALLAQENKANGITKTDQGMVMTAKSDLMEAAKSSIQINEILMGALSGVLIFMGILNYLNVIMTGMFSRREEFRTLRSIGMTQKQLKRMLMLEGGWYVLWVAGLVLTVGSGALTLTAWYEKTQVSYFRFFYPVGEEILIVAALIFICIGVPVFVQKRSKIS